MYVILFGTIADGHEAVGLFETRIEAEEYALLRPDLYENWEVIPIIILSGEEEE